MKKTHLLELAVVLFLLLSLPAGAFAGSGSTGSGPVFIVMPSTSYEAAVMTPFLANEPSTGLTSRITVTNVQLPPPLRFGLMYSPAFSAFSMSGPIEFHLYSHDGNYYFYETSQTLFAGSIGEGLDSQGRLGHGQTFTVTLDELLTAAQVERSFVGYAWIIGNFAAIQGTCEILNSVAGPSVFSLEPSLGTSLRTYGTLGGIPRRPQDLTVGLLAEITGAIPQVGASCVKGAQLAVEEINAAGGITIGARTHQVRLLVQDTEAAAERAAALVSEFATRTNAVALVGPNSSGNAIPAADVAESMGIPLITPWSTNPRTTLNESTGAPKQNVFRVCFTDVYEGQVLSKFARETLLAGKAAVLYDKDLEVLKSQAELFSESFEAAGGQIVAFEDYSTGQTDLTGQFTRIKAADPDVIFLPSYYTEVPDQVRQAHALGINVPFLGSDAWSTPALIAECGDDCEGFFLCNHYSAGSDNPRTIAFVDAFRARFNETPDDVAALTYDAFGFLRAGLAQAGRTGRQAVASGLRGIAGFQGVTGNMIFEPGSRDPIKGAVILQIKDGQFIWFADVAP